MLQNWANFSKKPPLQPSLEIAKVLVDDPYNWKNWAGIDFCRGIFHGARYPKRTSVFNNISHLCELL